MPRKRDGSRTSGGWVGATRPGDFFQREMEHADKFTIVNMSNNSTVMRMISSVNNSTTIPLTYRELFRTNITSIDYYSIWRSLNITNILWNHH